MCEYPNPSANTINNKNIHYIIISSNIIYIILAVNWSDCSCK